MKLDPLRECKGIAKRLGLSLHEGENSMNGEPYIAVTNKHGYGMYIDGFYTTASLTYFLRGLQAAGKLNEKP